MKKKKRPIVILSVEETSAFTFRMHSIKCYEISTTEHSSNSMQYQSQHYRYISYSNTAVHIVKTRLREPSLRLGARVSRSLDRLSV
jgi:hypothetical protein